MSIRPFFKISIVLLVTILLVNCGRGVSNASASASDAPTVLMEVQPTDAIGTTRQVAVLFSKPMNPASITPSSFLVEGVTGTVT